MSKDIFNGKEGPMKNSVVGRLMDKSKNERKPVDPFANYNKTPAKAGRSSTVLENSGLGL